MMYWKPPPPQEGPIDRGLFTRPVAADRGFFPDALRAVERGPLNLTRNSGIRSKAAPSSGFSQARVEASSRPGDAQPLLAPGR